MASHFFQLGVPADLLGLFIQFWRLGDAFLAFASRLLFFFGSRKFLRALGGGERLLLSFTWSSARGVLTTAGSSTVAASSPPSSVLQLLVVPIPQIGLRLLLCGRLYLFQFFAATRRLAGPRFLLDDEFVAPLVFRFQGR